MGARRDRFGPHDRGDREAEAGAFAGSVRNTKTGAGIANAIVSCGSYSATTAGNGSYSIANVAPGAYSCKATANRYSASTKGATVLSGQTATTNFSLIRQ